MSIEDQLPHRKSHRLSHEVYNTTEYEYSFTVCARHQRNKPFLNPALAQTVIDSLLWTRQKYHWLLFCYCLMPDHLHFVCRLTQQEHTVSNLGNRGWMHSSVLEHLARFKSYTTTQAWNFGIQGKLWQRSSFDRVLDAGRPFENVVEYTLQNPQRAGLVNDWEQWPYSQIVDPW